MLILYHCQNKVTTLYPFFIFLVAVMCISIPGHVFLNFSGTAQNWMAIVVLPHYPLPRGCSFLELDYWEETDHSEDFLNFIGASPKLDAKWMMHHHDDLSMLMVASAGEADRFSMKNKLSSISALCLLRTKMISFVSSPWLRWRRSHLSRWCNFITHLAIYEPNVSSKKDRRWY